MLSPNDLERGSQAYQKGYRDGYNGNPASEGLALLGTFVAHDYAEGYKAGGNDAKWDKAAACKQWNIRRGKPCTCGKHKNP